MFTKIFAAIKNFMLDVFYFLFGGGIASIVLVLVCGALGLLSGDGIVSDVTSVAVVILSIIFGILVVKSEPQKKSNAQENTQESKVLSKNKMDPAVKVNTYKVSGITHYMDNIMALAVENSDYSLPKKKLIETLTGEKKIWKYEFPAAQVKLIPEPDNAYDPNAIKVIADGKHVGYIKAGSCSHMLKCIREQRIVSIGCKIGGGPYKILREDYDIDKDKQIFTLEKGDAYYYVHLSVAERV